MYFIKQNYKIPFKIQKELLWGTQLLYKFILLYGKL